MTPKATQSEKIAGSNELQDQSLATGNWGQVQSNNAELNGAVESAPYYQNEVKAGTGATTAGFDASKRNLKQSMEAAGVQGNSGVAAGNETALGAEEADALGKVKTNAYADTQAQKFAANAEDLTAAGQESQGGLGYADINNKDAVDRQHQGQAGTSALAQAVAMAAFA